MISIVVFTSMLAIELFYLTHLRSFIGCFSGYLPLFIPIGLRYILDSGRFGHVPLFIRQ